ncbi:hypothetical protein SADUNF_Sadunf16G0009200 [Salix dunnii]|uniref:Uncharacterized protein n=1 Tax=Salix dunnii TaxID=1413687 RepID=A0A835J9R3_9ROSI|nr:hypothetical protein SADUNF_Sadunf16G0009200 [Salix dunnii]
MADVSSTIYVRITSSNTKREANHMADVFARNQGVVVVEKIKIHGGFSKILLLLLMVIIGLMLTSAVAKGGRGFEGGGILGGSRATGGTGGFIGGARATTAGKTLACITWGLASTFWPLIILYSSVLQVSRRKKNWRLSSQLRQNLQLAQQRMKAHADQHRREVTFEVGDYVYLRLQPYCHQFVVKRQSPKLAPRGSAEDATWENAWRFSKQYPHFILVDKDVSRGGNGFLFLLNGGTADTGV